MPASLEQSATESLIRLEGTVDINCAAELRQLLLQALALPHPVTVAVAGLEEVDVTAVQLLWQAGREAKSRGAALSFSGRLAGNIRASLSEAGFEDWLSMVDPDWRTA